MTGIRIGELRLAGTVGSGKTYGLDFRPPGASEGFRSLSVIAGQSLTGKTTIVDFIRYCLGEKNHPQHEEILRYVRAALLEVELDGSPTVIERAAAGEPSSFASVWPTTLAGIPDASSRQVPIEPTSDPEGLSQLILEACGLDGILLPDSASKDETATQTLSIRDVFNVIFIPNERLDNKSLVFEQANFMVRQKYRQTVDAMFGVHDNEDAVLVQRYRTAREKARSAEVRAATLRQFANDEYPRGALQLAIDFDEASTTSSALKQELATLDAEQRSTQAASQSLRSDLTATEQRAKEARVRVRDRRSLIERLDALRGQYADDQRKLNFLLDAEHLFDPLQVEVCPACLNPLLELPEIADGRCTLCSHEIDREPGGPDSSDRTAPGTAFVETELRAVKARLKSLNEYVSRLNAHQRVLIEEQLAAVEATESAARALDAILSGPAPWLALRDSITARISDARLAEYAARAGVDTWSRVNVAEERAAELAGQAAAINALRKEVRQRPDRTEVINALSQRFASILGEIGYPKLSNAYIANDLVPHVRGLPYSEASSGGMVLIGLAWNLALWELAHERDASSPRLLVIDSPQKNLGHNSVPGDGDFADAELVENFYEHVRHWLSADGAGAQLIVIDNSPPSIVDNDVVIRFTRSATVPPYGLIPEAMD